MKTAMPCSTDAPSFRIRKFSGRRESASTGTSRTTAARRCEAAPASSRAGPPMSGSRTRSATRACSRDSTQADNTTRSRSIRIPIATSRRERRPVRRPRRYELALTNPDFKFPQIWRSNIAVDHRLPGGVDGHRRIPLQQGRQRHLLHQRQSSRGADDLHRRRCAAAMDGQSHHTTRRATSSRTRSC